MRGTVSRRAGGGQLQFEGLRAQGGHAGDGAEGNAGTIIAFRLGAEDAKYLAREFYPVFDATKEAADAWEAILTAPGRNPRATQTATPA